MPKIKHYTRQDLNINSDDTETQQIKYDRIEIFINKIQGLENPNLTFEEKEWVFESVLGNCLYFENKNPYWLGKDKILFHGYLEDFRFRYLFIQCEYANDVNGDKIHGHLFFGKYFSQNENKENVKFLDKMANDWSEIIKKRNHKDIYLQKISIETEQMFEEEFKYTVDYEEKSLKRKQKEFLLYYRFIYISSQKIFSKSASLCFLIGTNQITYDIESFYHVARHFAKTLKPDLLNKSFFSRDFEIHTIFNLLSKNFNLANQKNIFLEFKFSNSNQIFFKYNELIYSLWINKGKDLSGNNIFRVDSFYPSESLEERKKYDNLIEVEASSNLSFFI